MKKGKKVKVYTQMYADPGEPNMEHSYDIKGDSIHYSKTADWNEGLKGKKAGYYKDSGDEVFIKIGKNKPLRLEYYEVEILKAILLHFCKDKIEFK